MTILDGKALSNKVKKEIKLETQRNQKKRFKRGKKI